MILKALGFNPQTMKVRTELTAGLTTFLTMSYILAVNPDIMSAASMDKGAVFTATALSSAIATLIMAFLARVPFALAPGMGINAFFAFTVVQGMGYSWETALTAVFIEGLVFVLLTVFNIRQLVVHSIPQTIRLAITAGIGLFITFIGLTNCGIITSNPVTFIALGKVTPTTVLAFAGILLSGVLMAKKVKGALFYMILLATLVGIERGFNSTDFAIVTVFALIIMYDASGVRRAVGKQATILNKILDDLHHKKHIEQKRLKELIGHTPKEVLFGAILGILTAIVFV